MKKIIITLSMLLVFSAVSIGTMDAFSSKDLERQATFSRLATFNVAQGNIGDSDYEPANPNPNAYYISNYIEDPALRNGSYGYEVNQTAADKQEYEISYYTVDAINRYHSSSRPGIYAGTEEYEPTTDEDLRSGYVYYDIAPEFSMANDFTTSYAKLVGDEFEDYTLTSDDLIVNNNSSTPRFTSAGTAAGIEDGAVLIHSDNAEGEYTWKTDRLIPGVEFELMPGFSMMRPMYNKFDTTLELNPYIYGTLTPHTRAGSTYVATMSGSASGYAYMTGDGSVDGHAIYNC